MADIKLKIVNAAITAAGEEPLTELTPGTVMANAAIENYDDFVEEEIENGVWKFATKTDTPTLLTATASDQLKYQWQRFADDIEVQAVLYKGTALEGVDYDVQGRIVLTRYNSDIEIKYSYRPDESEWPQRFKRIIVGRLKALFMSVTERHSDAKDVDAATDIKSKIARHTEARQRKNRPLGDGTLVQARMGLRPRRSF